MKLLAIGRPAPGVDARRAITRHARDELRELWKLYGNGFVREVYDPAGPGAILVLEAESLQTAERQLRELPLVSNQIVDFDLIELRPFTAFRLLFADGDDR